MAYTDEAGYHRHKCAFCAFVWHHHHVNDRKHGSIGAHECPACHRCNWSLGVYTGDEPPKVRNGEVFLHGPMFAIHPDQKRD